MGSSRGGQNLSGAVGMVLVLRVEPLRRPADYRETWTKYLLYVVRQGI